MDKVPVQKDRNWRVQRVWDKDGQVLKVEGEKSLSGPGLMECLENDNTVPLDS